MIIAKNVITAKAQVTLKLPVTAAPPPPHLIFQKKESSPIKLHIKIKIKNDAAKGVQRFACFSPILGIIISLRF